MNNTIFTAIVDSRKQEEIAANAMREAIVEYVIYRTSVKNRVNEDYYYTVKTEVKKSINSKSVVLLIGAEKETFPFYFGEGTIIKSLYKLMKRLEELDCFYEDLSKYIESGNEYRGFCWHSNRGLKCGLYTTDETTATEEEFEDALKEANEAYNLEGEYCNWEA